MRLASTCRRLTLALRATLAIGLGWAGEQPFRAQTDDASILGAVLSSLFVSLVYVTGIVFVLWPMSRRAMARPRLRQGLRVGAALFLSTAAVAAASGLLFLCIGKYGGDASVFLGPPAGVAMLLAGVGFTWAFRVLRPRVSGAESRAPVLDGDALGVYTRKVDNGLVHFRRVRRRVWGPIELGPVFLALIVTYSLLLLYLRPPDASAWSASSGGPSLALRFAIVAPFFLFVTASRAIEPGASRWAMPIKSSIVVERAEGTAYRSPVGIIIDSGKSRAASSIRICVVVWCDEPRMGAPRGSGAVRGYELDLLVDAQLFFLDSSSTDARRIESLAAALGEASGVVVERLRVESSARAVTGLELLLCALLLGVSAGGVLLLPLHITLQDAAWRGGVVSILAALASYAVRMAARARASRLIPEIFGTAIAHSSLKRERARAWLWVSVALLADVSFGVAIWHASPLW